MDFDNGRASSSADGESNYNASDEGESDANAEDQHGHDTAGEQEREVQASQPPVRRRRNRKVTQWPADKIVVNEIMENGMPTEEKAMKRMRRLAGLIARQRLPLTLVSFNVLTAEQRDKLFKDCVQPWLEFEEPLQAKASNMMMRMVNKSWRTHKSYLIREFVNTGLEPFEKHPYIPREEWEVFARLQETDEAKERSEFFKNLRAKNKHDHNLGTGGYATALRKWRKQDMELAAKGLSNPWHKYPEGRPRNYLRGHGKLVMTSKGVPKIQWVSKSSAESVAQKVVEKQAELESSGLTKKLVRDKDVLSQVLGKEQTGRIRGVSSYCGWKFWPNYQDMYRKRKLSDVDRDAIKEELRAEVTRDVIAMLRAQGVNLPDLPSNTLPSLGAKNNSFASGADAVCSSVQLDGPGGNGNSYPNPVDLLTGPTHCTLVSNRGGYPVEVARGQVFPKQTQLYSVPVQEGYVVVLVEYVYPDHESFVLTLPPTDEITTLGEALFKRVQWSKSGIVISPNEASSKSSLKPTQPGRSAKVSLKDFACNVLSSQDENDESAPTVGKCASKELAERKKQTNNSTHGPVGSFASSGAHKSKNTKRGRHVGVKQQQQAEPTKSSRSTPEDSLLIHPNPKFKFGQPMLSSEELLQAGPKCVELHEYYMNACVMETNTGIIGRVESHYFLLDDQYVPLTVGFEDVFDLLTFDSLDVTILRVITLYIIAIARKKSLPVALLDPEALRIDTLKKNRAYSVAYLEKCLMEYDKGKYVEFAYNSGRHWIAVVIVPSWHKVLYLDSNRGGKTNLSLLISVIDEAYATYRAKKGKTEFKLTHVTKFPCLQQGVDNTCGFFAAHHLLSMLSFTKAVDSKDLDLNTTVIRIDQIRERISKFILEWIIDPDGPFHDPAGHINNSYIDDL